MTKKKRKVKTAGKIITAGKIKKTSRPEKRQNPVFEHVLAEEAKLAESRREKENEKSGHSDNLDRLERELSKEPNALKQESTVPPKPKATRALAPVLKIPFAIWANIEDIPEIKLSQDEAIEWAEPIVELLEYYFPGKIPEIAWMWLMLLESTGRVIDSRVDIRHQKKKHLSSGTSPEANKTAEHQGPDSSLSAESPAPAHTHNGAEPASGFPQDG